jgi:hypothetical protein
MALRLGVGPGCGEGFQLAFRRPRLGFQTPAIGLGAGAAALNLAQRRRRVGGG